MTPAQLKELVLRAPLGEFVAIAAAVDERRGGDDVDLADKALAVVSALSPDDILASVKVGLGRGDASMLGRLMELIEKARATKTAGAVTVNIEHYTVPDESIPHIIAHCADEQYKPIEAAVFARRAKVQSTYKHRAELKAKKANEAYEAMSPEQRAAHDATEQKRVEMEKAQAMVEAEYKKREDPTYLPDDMLGGDEFEDEDE